MLTKLFLAKVIILMTITQGISSSMKDISFKSTLDGTTQKYVELLPDNFDNTQKHDLIIGLHGHGSDRWQFAKDKRAECRAFRDFATQNNMIAITPDYRAKTSWMGPAAEADMLQIITDIKKKYKINRVFLSGGSMGGTSTLTFTALHPELIAGITCLNPHANHLEYENFQDAIAASFGGSKQQIPTEYKKRSAEYWPEKFTMPVAITTGGKDKSVPPHSAIRLAKILQKLNPNALLINRPKTGHSTNYQDTMKALNFMLNKVNR